MKRVVCEIPEMKENMFPFKEIKTIQCRWNIKYDNVTFDDRKINRSQTIKDVI